MFTTRYLSNTSINTEALQLILDAHTEMQKNGVIDIDYGIEVRIHDEAFLLIKDKLIIGILSFYEMEKSIWISLSYIKPEFRKLGGWTKLREVLKSRASHINKSAIYSGVTSNNEASFKANLKIARPSMTVFKQLVEKPIIKLKVV